jgi:hypothetical protein
MKLRVYMRVAHGSRGPRVAASTSPNYEPIQSGSGWNSKALPTAHFALDLTVPESVIEHAERVLAELEIPEEAVDIAVGIGAP